jgi:hypothetical protein
VEGRRRNRYHGSSKSERLGQPYRICVEYCAFTDEKQGNGGLFSLHKKEHQYKYRIRVSYTVLKVMLSYCAYERNNLLPRRLICNEEKML